MLTPMNGEDDDVGPVQAEVQGVREPIKDCAPCLASHDWELYRVLGEAFDCLVQCCPELGAEPRPPAFVPVSRFECFSLSLGPEVDAGSLSIQQLPANLVPGDGRLRSPNVIRPASV
jgi:hypothetical protein